MNILITGCAGFIGFHLANRLTVQKKYNIIGIDNLNNYYDVNIKKQRLKILKSISNFNYIKCDLNQKIKLKKIFTKYKFKIVINLAAQAGVRYSITNPDKYFDANLSGFFNILENCKEFKVEHLLFASTSSVYGKSTKFPLKEQENTDRPISFYAATKKCNEIMAYSYSSVYNLRTTALRFFTVYGPYGRPDMSLFKFVDSIFKNKKIDLYNKGDHIRDFTYVDDVVESIFRLIKAKYIKNKPYEVFNIASNNPKKLRYFLKLIEKNMQKKSSKNLLKLQKGDIYKTHGDNEKLFYATKYKPKYKIEAGINKFINWYLYDYTNT
tara:strand:- start:489 stop:1460 length:972 start_codon:yes stop_codon:yes gene_type:complete